MHYERSTIWEKSMQLAEAACQQATCLPRDERFGMRRQMSRAAVSVVCNVAEGWSRESRKEKAQFLAIAHGSLAELHTQIVLCSRLRWLDGDGVRQMLDLVAEIARMLTALRQRLRSEIATKPTTSSS